MTVPPIRLQLSQAGYSTPSGQVLLEPMDLAVFAGECLAIVGPNGAGKSTLLRMMAGLLLPSTGQVLLDGCAMHGMNPLQRAQKIALLSQSDHVDARLRLEDYVALGCLAPPQRAHTSTNSCAGK